MGNYPSQNDEFVKEFFKRTLHNLAIYLEDHQKDKMRYPYDVTQIVNSFLGLIVFIKDTQLSNPKLEQFIRENPPMTWTCNGSNNIPEEHIFQNYLKRLRNAISHRKVTSISNEENQIITLVFKDGYNGGCFHTELSIENIHLLINLLRCQIIGEN